MLTDSACLLSMLIRSSKTSELRFMIYLVATQQKYDNRNIDDVACFKTGENNTDAFPKLGQNDAWKRHWALD